MLTETGGNPYQRAFLEELRRLGYVEGGNLVVDRHSAEGVLERNAEVARDAVARAPDLIFANSVPMALRLKEATRTIPIVGIVNDPVATGLAPSLSRPGGNMTGVVVDAGLEVWEKRFELLREAVPTVFTVAFLVTQGAWEFPYGHAVRQAAQKAGVSLTLAKLDPIYKPEDQHRRALEVLRQEHVDALAFSEAPSTIAHRQLIADLVQEIRLPAMYPYRALVEGGGLMAYTVDVASLMRHAARQVDQILKGANPGELPFFQTTKFELWINLKTARALGLTIPPTLLARADEVIE